MQTYKREGHGRGKEGGGKGKGGGGGEREIGRRTKGEEKTIGGSFMKLPQTFGNLLHEFYLNIFYCGVVSVTLNFHSQRRNVIVLEI